MNLASNPWSFTSADVKAVAASASPTGMVQQGALNSVLYTSGSAHGFTAGQYVTYAGDTNSRFLGAYQVANVPSATTALLTWLSTPTSGSPPGTVVAASGGGTLYLCQWPWQVRAEDISVLATAAAPGATPLVITDINGNIVWTFIGVATDEGFASQNRGKVMWTRGITLQQVPVNCTVLITVN